MEIKSVKYKDCSLKLLGEKVDFNIKGVATVSDEFGEAALLKYGDILNPPKPNKVEVKKSDDVAVLKLQNENEILEQKIDELKNKLQVSDEAVVSWKDEYTKVVNGDDREGGDNETILTATTVPDQDIELILEISKKSVKALKEFAVGLKYPEEEWSEMTGDNLKFYLANKVVNANS